MIRMSYSQILRLLAAASLALPLCAFQSTTTEILAKLGHSQHGPAFDTGPREKPWPMTGIGVAHFPITTSNPEVQMWFDQGNALCIPSGTTRLNARSAGASSSNPTTPWLTGDWRAPARCAVSAAPTVLLK